MIERMSDTIGFLWAMVLAAGAAVISTFYRHGGRLSRAEARIDALEKTAQENKKWLIKIHSLVNDIQIRLGGPNGKRRIKR